MKRLVMLLLMLISVGFSAQWERVSIENHAGVKVNGAGSRYIKVTTTARLKIPSGWIVRTIVVINKHNSVHTVVISDHNHLWKLD